MNRLIPVVTMVLTAILIQVFRSKLGYQFEFDKALWLLFSAVLFCSWYGGRFYGFMAAIFSVLVANLVSISPQGFIWPEKVNLIRIGLFLINSTFVILIIESLRHTKNKAQKAYSDLKLTEEFWRQSEAQFRSVFESSMMGLVFIDFKSRVLEANDYFLNMINLDKKRFKEEGLFLHAITPPEFLEKSIMAMDELRLNGVVTPFEKEYFRKDGTRVPVLVGGARMEHDIIATFILDISERKRAELDLVDAYSRLEEHVLQRTHELREANQELKRLVAAGESAAEEIRQSQLFLDSVIENIPNMISVKGALDLKYIRLNRAGEQFLGCEREKLIGRSDYDLYPKEAAEQLVKQDKKIIAGKVLVDISEESIPTELGPRYVHTRKIPILGKDGEPLYLLGISEDITERKTAEVQRLSFLQEQAARVEAEKSAERFVFLSAASGALNESLDIHTMLQGFGRVIVDQFSSWCSVELISEANGVVEKIVVYRDRLGEIHHGAIERQEIDENSPCMSGLVHVIRTGRAVLFTGLNEESLQEKFGETHFFKFIGLEGKISVMMIPLLSYGKVIGAITLVSPEAQRIYDDVDLSVAQDLAKRTLLAIENARLFRQAQEASRTKSAFLANISHEIRTPLGAILGFAELMLDKQNPSSEQNLYLATIIRNAGQLLGIVDEILDLSKVESDHIQIEKILFSIKKLIDDVHTLLSMKATEKGLQLEITFDLDDSEQIISDPTRIRQILINVIGNAIKFTERGKVSVHVALISQDKRQDKRKDILKVTVRDTGIGISEEQKKNLFFPFSQADSSMTRRFGGTGLGLFLSRKLARLFGGDLMLEESAPGVGSVFVLTLEVDRNEKKLAASTAKSTEKYPLLPLKPSTTLANFKVLMVDDAQDNRTLVGLYLSSLGLKSDVAASGLEGVEKALHHHYDVVLLDIQMPDMDGFAALQMLRRSHYKGPVVALTAHAMKGDREKCLEFGFDDYLRKPLDRESLKKCLLKFAVSEPLKETI